MKLTKTLFKTEIEIQPRELRELMESTPPFMLPGLNKWLVKNLGLDLLNFVEKQK